METKGEWIHFEESPHLAFDALGAPIDNVESARETDGGIEVIAIAISPEGEEFVMSHDGVNIEAVRARMDIPGGMLERDEE